MAAIYFIQFDPADNPMHLSKVGNWVFTYLNPQEELVHIQLAITTVLPCHVSENLQAQRICIAKTEQENQWKINSIECYDSHQGKDVYFHPQDDMGRLVLEKLMDEFDKYDIPLTLTQHDA